MPVINVMEHMVDAKLSELLPKSSCCKCQRCIDDIRAVALNKLPPKYVSTNAGELFTRVNSLMEHQVGLDIEFAVLSAIEIVASNPRHDAKESDKEE